MHRSERLEPKCTKSRTEWWLPNFAKLLTDNEEPRTHCPTTEVLKQLPAKKRPLTLQLLPIRANARRLSEEPRDPAVSVLMELPNLTNDLTEIELPMLAKCRTETDEPSRANVRREQLLPR
jgi:hypothetical protein